MIGDISPLVGRRFVAASGNVCRIQRLEQGAIRIVWHDPSSERDRAEFEKFAEGVLGPIEVERHAGGAVSDPERLRQEAEDLRNWRKRSR